jgi:hypothetical protein
MLRNNEYDNTEYLLPAPSCRVISSSQTVICPDPCMALFSTNCYLFKSLHDLSGILDAARLSHTTLIRDPGAGGFDAWFQPHMPGEHETVMTAAEACRGGEGFRLVSRAHRILFGRLRRGGERGFDWSDHEPDEWSHAADFKYAFAVIHMAV